MDLITLSAIVGFGLMSLGLRRLKVRQKKSPVESVTEPIGNETFEFIPGLLPRDLGLKGFDQIRGIHLGSCPGLDTYKTTAYYTETVKGTGYTNEIFWIYPTRHYYEGAHTHLNPGDPYYLHICFWDAGYVKTTVLIHEYCHVLWAIEKKLEDDIGKIYERHGQDGLTTKAHDRLWKTLMLGYGLEPSEYIYPESLGAEYYVD